MPILQPQPSPAQQLPAAPLPPAAWATRAARADAGPPASQRVCGAPADSASRQRQQTTPADNTHRYSFLADDRWLQKGEEQRAEDATNAADDGYGGLASGGGHGRSAPVLASPLLEARQLLAPHGRADGAQRVRKVGQLDRAHL